ncbi:hypothetical protein B0T22DRAFT_458475 [Podospora appendiculata]|uniref:Uncharacterized protein n=1 Tax=Podospora appendiculata TaxID=314037 RepID=A0AAE0X8G2_9PEZI|nr:hypothetical protein B0T22DRAFT_458475 [Podospora appendiculata]
MDTVYQVLLIPTSRQRAHKTATGGAHNPHRRQCSLSALLARNLRQSTSRRSDPGPVSRVTELARSDQDTTTTKLVSRLRATAQIRVQVVLAIVFRHPHRSFNRYTHSTTPTPTRGHFRAPGITLGQQPAHIHLKAAAWLISYLPTTLSVAQSTQPIRVVLFTYFFHYPHRSLQASQRSRSPITAPTRSRLWPLVIQSDGHTRRRQACYHLPTTAGTNPQGLGRRRSHPAAAPRFIVPRLLVTYSTARNPHPVFSCLPLLPIRLCRLRHMANH